jgi:hypothetical protein
VNSGRLPGASDDLDHLFSGRFLLGFGEPFLSTYCIRTAQNSNQLKKKKGGGKRNIFQYY